MQDGLFKPRWSSNMLLSRGLLLTVVSRSPKRPKGSSLFLHSYRLRYNICTKNIHSRTHRERHDGASGHCSTIPKYINYCVLILAGRVHFLPVCTNFFLSSFSKLEVKWRVCSVLTTLQSVSATGVFIKSRTAF